MRTPLARLVELLEIESADSQRQVEHSADPVAAATAASYRFGIKVALTMARHALDEEQVTAESDRTRDERSVA